MKIPKFTVKIVNDRIVIDLNRKTDDQSQSYGYDGSPNFFNANELSAAVPLSEINITKNQLDIILEQYETGGKCGQCGTIVSELSGHHFTEHFTSEGMCKKCWKYHRKMYLGYISMDIGDFKPIPKVCK